VINLFKSISDNDCIAMGMNPEWTRPEWMVITVLPVPPMPVRPSITMEGKGTAHDDLTYKLIGLQACLLTIQISSRQIPI